MIQLCIFSCPFLILRVLISESTGVLTFYAGRRDIDIGDCFCYNKFIKLKESVMTITVPNLKGEVLRLSDSQHSEVLSKEHNTFTLSKGEKEFTVEQTAASVPRSKIGWVIFLLMQIITALPRAIGWRKPIFVRCNPILLNARVEVTSFRFSDLTLFLDAGGYNIDTHSYNPPVLTGDKELKIIPEGYHADTASVESAIREEKMSKLGYYVGLFSVPIALVILAYLTNYGIFFAVALGSLPFMIAFTLMGIAHSKRVCHTLRDKVEDTLRHWNEK